MRRIAIFVIVAICATAVIWWMASGSPTTTEDLAAQLDTTWPRVVSLTLLLAVLGAGMIAGGPRLVDIGRAVLLWGALAVILIAAYSYRAEKTEDAGEKLKLFTESARTWRDRLHVDKSGKVFIPPMAFKGALETAARFNPISIPGRGKSTYTKHFRAGILVVDPVFVGATVDEVEGEWLLLNSDGRKGGGTFRPYGTTPGIDINGGRLAPCG